LSTPSTLSTPSATEPRPAPADRPLHPGDPVAAGSRGRTTIAERAVAKVAAAAAAELEGVGGPRGRLTNRSSRRRPGATASLSGRWVRVALEVSIDYPLPVRPVARQLREHVAAQVGRLTGLDAREVDITVVSLPVAAETDRQVR
jgi:uncharacterized alkaline shock family protein YloU